MKALAVAVGAFAATGAVLAFAAACRKAGALIDQQWEDGMAELGVARDLENLSRPSQLDQLWRDLENLSRPSQLDQLWRDLENLSRREGDDER